MVSGISHPSEGSGIKHSQTGAFWDNNFPKNPRGRNPTWMLFLIGFIQNSRLFWPWNKRAIPCCQPRTLLEKQGSWFVRPADPTIFQPTTSFHNPNRQFFIQPGFLGEKLGIFNYSSSGYSQTGENPQILKYNLNIKNHPRIIKELVGMFFIRMCGKSSQESCPAEEPLVQNHGIFMEYLQK